MEKKEYESPEIEICKIVSFSAQIARSGRVTGLYYDDVPPPGDCDHIS